MKIRARAPVRIDFLGGGSDCPPFSTEFTGSVLNAGITRYVQATIEVGGNNVSITSKDLNALVSAASIDDLAENTKLDLLVKCVKRSSFKTGFSLIVESDVPPQSGLGASGAVAVAVLAALHYAEGVNLSPSELANLAFIVERHDLGFPGGSQDQYGAAFGGFNFLTFHDPGVQTQQLAGKYAAQPIALKSSIITELEQRLLLIYTGEPHMSENIHADILTSYGQPNSPTKAAMHRLARVAEEGRNILLKGDLETFADLLSENWKWHKELHFSCSNDDLEKIHRTALQSGAIGGKTCGAGGGGCVVFLCEEGAVEDVYRSLQSLKIEELKRLKFSFDMEGVKVCSAE